MHDFHFYWCVFTAVYRALWIRILPYFLLSSVSRRLLLRRRNSYTDAHALMYQGMFIEFDYTDLNSEPN